MNFHEHASESYMVINEMIVNREVKMQKTLVWDFLKLIKFGCWNVFENNFVTGVGFNCTKLLSPKSFK